MDNQENTHDNTKIYLGISATLSVIVGVYVLVNDWTIVKNWSYLIGMALILLGVFTILLLRAKAFAFVGLGLYFIARASGLIDHQWLRWGLGIPMLILGFVLFYQMFTYGQDPEPPKASFDS